MIQNVFERQQRWVKVHAAEYLLALDYPEGVQEAFIKELESHQDDPQYRIGICRVLARAAVDNRGKSEWIDKIREACFAPKAPHRLHATETLAKLHYRLRDDEVASIEQAAQRENDELAPYAAWILLNSDKPGAEDRLAALLQSSEDNVRSGAAYALRHQPSISAATRKKLSKAAGEEPPGTRAHVFLVAAAAVHAAPEDRDPWKTQLTGLAVEGTDEQRRQACQTLARIGDCSDLPMLSDFLDDPNPDLRAAAANAILRMGRRASHRLTFWDWGVIGLYACGLIAVGWYYARRTKTREQYFLGDRKMRPSMVGLSLFAALISTISYLATPGEIIKYGPMFISYLLIFPLIVLFGGWLLIPFIMRLKVTSAYEILEVRLGPVVRTIGSLLFLLLRMGWMAVIVYATTSKVLVPLLGLEPWTTPIVCGVLALLAITYTTMGGLRAAVVTDVIQTGILVSAAIVTILVITISLGGVQSWWPSQWPLHWPKPTYGFDPAARMTMIGIMLAVFTWWVCTMASDQIAVQRYLSTKDVKAARAVLFITLGADALVMLLLAAVGLGLLAYFQTFPHLLPDSQAILADSDKLFAQFIVIGLPPGLSGLVIAGLLACAMSSLAAGINSTCSVVTVDFIDRIRRQNAKAEAGHISQLRNVSIFVGVAVVLLSLLVNMVQGNLLEVCFKVVNLLTVPLGGLFLIAMFVPWARAFGTLVGLAFGLATVVLISFETEIFGTTTISFVYAMPIGLVVEVGVGALASLIPIGKVKPMQKLL